MRRSRQTAEEKGGERVGRGGATHRILFFFTHSVTAIADKLGIEFALIHRQRNGKNTNAPERMEVLVGDVRDKVAILVDDMIDTGKTLALAANTLKERGAKAIYALVSHGEFVYVVTYMVLMVFLFWLGSRSSI